MGRDWKGKELKGSSGITPHLDNITQVLDIALFCINQFIHNIPADQIFFSSIGTTVKVSWL